MAPDRRELLNMSQKDNESFKEYAQRWREMASQVEPPLAEKELADWFMDTVQPMFYERMVGSVSASFSDLVVVGIKVELGLKNGKMISAAGTSNNNNAKKFLGNFQKKRKEMNVVSSNRGRSQSWRKQQQQFTQQQPAYTVQYV